MMKKDNLYLQNLEESYAPTQTPLRPIHALERGASILEELASQAVEPQDKELEELFEALTEKHGGEMIQYVAVKFGIVTSTAAGQSPLAMQAHTVAERILERHRVNPDEFRDALLQVVTEEKNSTENNQFCDLHEFEGKTLEAFVELAMLSGNPLLEEMIQFADELDAVFQGHSYLFSYLEHRYSDCFHMQCLSPEFLAVQVALDYLSYREQYQLAIISDYEALLANGKTDPFAHAAPNAMQ